MHTAYSPLIDRTELMTRQQVQSLLSAADALQSGRPFSSTLTGHTYHADALAELVDLERPPLAMEWTPAQEMEYRELVARH